MNNGIHSLSISILYKTTISKLLIFFVLQQNMKIEMNDVRTGSTHSKIFKLPIFNVT